VGIGRKIVADDDVRRAMWERERVAEKEDL